MVVTRVYGGLGNQLFQYAAGLGVACRLSTGLVVDARWFEVQYPNMARRVYELSAFGIGPSFTRLRRLRLRLAGVTHFGRDGNVYEPQIEELEGNVFLDGYWQDERYFRHCAEHVRAALEFRRPLGRSEAGLQAEIAACDAVAVHVRRGDYVSNPWLAEHFGALPLAYYEAAFAEVRSRVERPRFFVFSDEPSWCESALGDRPDVRVVAGDPGSGYDALVLMASCRHAIIANSSLSWWGAWLGATESGLVVAPDPWYWDAFPGAQPVPPGWLRLAAAR